METGGKGGYNQDTRALIDPGKSASVTHAVPSASLDSAPVPSLGSLLPSWLASAWLVSKAQWFWNHWPDCQFGWIVLLLCGYIFWEAWPGRPPGNRSPNWMAVPLVGAAAAFLLFIQVYEAAFGPTPASLLGLALGLLLIIAANVHHVFGWPGVRHFGMAFGFILVSLPWPSFIYGPVVLGLQRAVAELNVELLVTCGIPAQKLGSVIRLPTGLVGIDEACSGIRSLQATLMAAVFIGHLTLRRISFKVGLIALSVVLAILGNLVRSFFLSYTASVRGVAAIQQVHDTAGWSILVFTTLGVAASAWLLTRTEKVVTAAEGAGSPAAPDQIG